MQHAAAGDDRNEALGREFAGLEKERGERDQHDQRQPEKRNSHRSSKTRNHASPPLDDRRPAHRDARLIRIDGVEHAAILEVLRLRLGPAAEHVIDGEELHLR